MSVEALIEAIEADAAAEVARLLADADAAVAARVADAGTTARARVDAALASAEPAIRGAEARTINEARLSLVSLRTARLAAATEAAFGLAERRLAEIVDDDAERGRWETAIRGLVAETAAIIGSGELRVRPVDLALVGGVVEGPGRACLSLVADPTMPAGVRGRSTDGQVTVDATVAERLRRARTTLVPEVAARLGDPGAVRRPVVGVGA